LNKPLILRELTENAKAAVAMEELKSEKDDER